MARRAEVSGGESRAAGDDPERRGTDRRYGISEVSLVQRIERVGTNLEGDAFFDFCILGKRKIQL